MSGLFVSGAHSQGFGASAERGYLFVFLGGFARISLFMRLWARGAAEEMVRTERLEHSDTRS